MSSPLTRIGKAGPVVFKDVKPEDVNDWYIPLKDPLSGRAVINNVFVDLYNIGQCEPFIEVLYNQIEDFDGEKDFNLAIDWETFDSKKIHLKYRAHRQPSIEGEFIILRRMPMELPNTDELGMPEAIQFILTHENLNKGGLVVICGEPGNGKSTTTAAMIVDRLKMYSGFCLTLENPVEMPLHGRHNDGFCMQTPVDEGGFEEALSAAMRCYPTATNSILFLGEIRSAETAAEALRIANNGHLVITTLHASNVMTCLKRILTLAKNKNMNEEEANGLLASSLRLVLYQKLEVTETKEGDTIRRLKTSFLFSPDNQSPVANRIRSGNVDNMITEVEQQNQLLRNNQVYKLLETWKKSSDFSNSK